MFRYITALLSILCFIPSEINAQNLNLKILGSNTGETTTINAYNYNRNHVDLNSILNEVDSILVKTIKEGYIESEHFKVKKTNDSSFLVQFNLKNKYNEVEINYNDKLIDKKIVDNITEESYKGHFSIPIYKVEETLNYLNHEITNNGHPFSKIRLSAIKIKDKKTLTANLLIINNEEKRSLDNIIIKGYKKFPKSYLKRFLKINPQKTFNLTSIKNKLSALDNLRFAEQTKNPEVLFTKDSTSLYIYLQKSQSNTFDGFLGFTTNEETNKIAFNGYLNLQLNNNFNYGETFNLLYKSDENEQKDFQTTLNLPYILSTPLGIELSLNILKRDSTFTTINQGANIFYQINSKNKLHIGIEGIESNNLLSEIEDNTISDYKSNFYKLKYSYENRENFSTLYQLKTSINLEIGLGARKTRNNNTNQKKLVLDAYHVFQLNKNNSFYTKFNASTLYSDSFFENELFRFGGINSIRGFEENSIIANKYLVINTEYRYHLSKNIYTHSIIDFGKFENKNSNINENLYGFGLGFGIITKAGLLKFNFANGKTKDQNFKFSNSKIHISLVTIF